MPASQTFAFIYDFDYSSPSTYPAGISSSITLTDDIDGHDDGQTNAFGQLSSTTSYAELNGVTALYTGQTANGDPVIQYNGQNYILSNNGSLGGTPVGATSSDVFTYCFASGTLIDTQDGQAQVENLSIGDLLKTQSGAYAAVKWIGRQTISTLFHMAERLEPVRFTANSLGEGVPSTDLTVTADHGMIIQGIICQASALVNGTTICRVPLSELGDTFTVYHVETENHDVIFANGAAAETFIDNVSRRAFDNFAEFQALYGDEVEMTELSMPRAMSARQLPASIRRLISKQDAA